MDIKYVEQLIVLFKQFGLQELHIESPQGKIICKAPSGEPIFQTAKNDCLPKEYYCAPIENTTPPTQTENIGLAVRSPLVGTFYRATEPGATPLCTVGQKVSEGDPLGLIESMKVLTLITAPISGTVESILIENAQGVEWDQALIILKPL
ncbi:MAG: acetyl-CoA carboxylase biotin carboxyl carrier protein [Gammaproteobacteria bacterium]|nr:acetyl-CoA carboxylase biotin carboxyl carrier protein [Gammaproteobacteria bacterium]